MHTPTERYPWGVIPKTNSMYMYILFGESFPWQSAAKKNVFHKKQAVGYTVLRKAPDNFISQS